MRGKANEEPLTPELAFSLGQISVSILADNDHPRVSVGRDTRISGSMFEAALVAGLCSAGASVVKMGVVPTPVLSFSAASPGIDYGIVLSASHNPFYDNGIKFFDGKGEKLSSEIELRLERALRSSSGVSRVKRAIGAKIGRVTSDRTLKAHYIRHVSGSVFGTDGLVGKPLAGLRIVLDCAHGATYRLAPLVFKRLGATVIPLNVSPNGTNINRKCGSTSISYLLQAVIKYKADFGLAFDGDGDRCLAAGGDGTVVDGDAIITICALFMKNRGLLPQNTVVATVMTNMGVEAVLERNGITLIRTRVGDKYVAHEMRNSGFGLGGEQSGHLIFKDVLPTGDGIVTGLWVAKVVEESGIPLEKLVSVVKRYPQVIINVGVNNPSALVGLRTVKREVRQLEEQLGKRGRILVRPSGTEPVVRVMVEGESEREVREMAEEAARVISTRAHTSKQKKNSRKVG